MNQSFRANDVTGCHFLYEAVTKNLKTFNSFAFQACKVMALSDFTEVVKFAEPCTDSSMNHLEALSPGIPCSFLQTDLLL